ncbi:phage portal protein [Clostridium sp. CCUG 7971]|uniref:phage tail assembly chaperone n=1 Tax=Clostridium sp. CCUG 7971 TaxID=2811414 RepID=UPI001ABA0EFC|nr:phage portal protein [Clostridium sp. CCUG 7971]MBO3444015.1 phage portal protein [Clostridium sp. CCUG 7971]
MSLSAFLSQNVIKIENEKHVVSDRFVINGKPVAWEVQPITSQDDELLRKSCTKRVPIPGKNNQFTAETDFNKYVGLLAVKCTVYPNLNDAELQDSYKAMGADETLKKMLLPGEYADYLSLVQKINGFEQSFEDKVEEAKN